MQRHRESVEPVLVALIQVSLESDFIMLAISITSPYLDLVLGAWFLPFRPPAVCLAAAPLSGRSGSERDRCRPCPAIARPPAGLTPYEAIEAGTRNAAEAMGRRVKFSTIAVGKRADMILLQDNPLEDVANIQKRAGVVLNGRWFSEEQLQSMLDNLAASNRPGLLDRLWPLALVILALATILRKIR